jgi:hypothetical protein
VEVIGSADAVEEAVLVRSRVGGAEKGSSRLGDWDAEYDRARDER